jgi:hypothetical protein
MYRFRRITCTMLDAAAKIGSSRHGGYGRPPAVKQIDCGIHNSA